MAEAPQSWTLVRVISGRGVEMRILRPLSSHRKGVGQVIVKVWELKEKYIN